VSAADGGGDPSFWYHRPVAVTGATGFLGSHLTGSLTEVGADVVALVRDDVPPSPVTTRWADRVEVVRGEIEDDVLVQRLFGEYEVRTVFHLAAQSQVGVANRNPVSTWSSNILGTWTILEAARRSPGVEQVVTASTDKAYGAQPELPYHEAMPLMPRNPYDVSKACADLIATSYASTWELPVCITRCGNLFGPGDLNWERLVPGTIRSFAEGRRPVIRSDGTMVRDYLYVADAVAGYLRLAEALAEDRALRGEAFNFSTGTPTTVLDLVHVIGRIMGTELEPDVRAHATHEIDRQHLSAEKARRLLGWTAEWTLQEGLAESVDWYRRHLGTADPV
jgi:CDP-glucose 4,6-dehydratase